MKATPPRPAVQAVDQVEGVRHPHDPQSRQRNPQPAQAHDPVEGDAQLLDADPAVGHHDAGRRELHQEFRRHAGVPDVVVEPHQKHQRRAQGKRDPEWLLLLEARPQMRHQPEGHQPHQHEGRPERHPPQPRRRAVVQLPPTRLVHRAAPLRQPDHRRSEEQRPDSGDQQSDKGFNHGSRAHDQHALSSIPPNRQRPSSA